MSLATYIGTNIKISLSDEDSEDLIIIGDCFSSDHHKINVRKYQFSTPYVYEVSSHWGIEISKGSKSKRNLESKNKLIALCKILDSYLEKGDYFELYSCWVGEEDEKRIGELTLKLNHFNVNEINIYEHTLVRFEKV